MEATTIEIKNNDVFRFRYREKSEWGWDSRYHCFDGTLKAHKMGDGSIILRDTFWGDSSTSRSFTPEEARDRGTLEFVCNLDEVDPIKKHDLDYYDDEDTFVLYIHSGYQNEYYVRRGAERSQKKMLATLDKQQEEAEREIRHAKDQLKWIEEKRAKVESGDLDIYL